MQFLFSESDIDQQLIDQIIRPPRNGYSKTELGPQKRQVGNYQVQRQDFQVQNSKRENLYGSLFHPLNANSTKLVIYLHGNAGCRVEAIPLLEHLIPLNISVLAFDFSGCGMSQGKYVTLGCKEVDDLNCVMNYINMNLPRYTSISLFGRSMGAVVTLLYAGQQNKYPLCSKISSLVLDSPFSSFKKLAEEQAEKKFGSGIASLFYSGAIELLRKRITKDTGYDVFTLNLVQMAQSIKIPGIFCYSADDQLIDSSHSQRLMRNYGGPSQKTCFNGGHNAFRDKNYFVDVVSFFKKYFVQNNQQQNLMNPSIKQQTQPSVFQSQNQQLPQGYPNQIQQQQQQQQKKINNSQSFLGNNFMHQTYYIDGRQNSQKQVKSIPTGNINLNVDNRSKSQHARIVLGQVTQTQNIPNKINLTQGKQQQTQQKIQQQQVSQENNGNVNIKQQQCKGISLLGGSKDQNNLFVSQVQAQNQNQNSMMNQSIKIPFNSPPVQFQQQKSLNSSRMMNTFLSPQKQFKRPTVHQYQGTTVFSSFK